jgi:hypothetical protein
VLLVGNEAVVITVGVTMFTLKLDCALFVPSLTVSVICAEPVCPAAGIKLTVRFAPLPPKVMFALGTTASAEETADKLRFAAAVSPSPMVNASGPTAWSVYPT